MLHPSIHVTETCPVRPSPFKVPDKRGDSIREHIQLNSIVFSTHDKKTDHPSSTHKEQGLELILLLTQEIMEKNKGFTKANPSDKDPMTFISLKLREGLCLGFHRCAQFKSWGEQCITARSGWLSSNFRHQGPGHN